MWLAPVVSVTAQVLPPAATPGGAMPELPASPPVPKDLEDPAAAFPIPPSVERPLDVEEGDRLFVKKFTFKGVVDHLEAGVDAAELSQIIEDLRVERQGLNKVGEDGFTDPERAQIFDFMGKVVNDPDLEMNFEEYEALVDQLRAIKAERDAGMTIGQMQQIAATVTEYYRSAGFVLAQAFIPAQEVVDGVVEVEVLEGTLGSVLVEGNKRYKNELLARPFGELIDAPVTAQGIEAAILTADDYPGVSLFGVFQPGKEVGSSDLVLRVQEEDPFEANTRYDNHGTRFTGKKRILVDMAFNNLPMFGGGDRLALTALRQYNPQNAFFGEIRYEHPFVLPGTTLGASYAHNPFDIAGFGGILAGESKVADVYLRKSLIRSRQRNLWGVLGWKRTEEVSKANTVVITKDQQSIAVGEFRYDNIDAETRSINQARLGVSVGLGDLLGGNDRETVKGQISDDGNTLPSGRVGGSGTPASNDFSKATASYTRLQILTEQQSLLLRLDGQYSPDLLTSLQQYSIGGPNSVRAYPISEFQVDTAGFASAEWTVNAPGFSDKQFTDDLTWGQVLRVSFFADYAWGQVNDPSVSQQETIEAKGFGAALAFALPGKFSARVEWAHPFGRVRSSDGNASQGWFDLNYQW